MSIDLTNPWVIGWYTCTADADDVKHAKTEGRDIKVGDTLWRVAHSIGPIYPDHNHWAGYHLSGDEDVVLCAAAAPVLLGTLKEVLQRCSMSNMMREEIEAAINLAENGA